MPKPKLTPAGWKTIQVRVSPDEYELLTKHAEDNYVSVTAILRPSIKKVVDAIASRSTQKAA